VFIDGAEVKESVAHIDGPLWACRLSLRLQNFCGVIKRCLVKSLQSFIVNAMWTSNWILFYVFKN